MSSREATCFRELLQAAAVRVEIIYRFSGGLRLLGVEWNQRERLPEGVALLDCNTVLLFDPLVIDLQVVGQVSSGRAVSQIDSGTVKIIITFVA